ncbi:hypothetical protein ACIRU5_35810 [Streptomyces misionensis]|uniref:hypothetical protein n=1 Tax=Streptomyces misionensis TaxID=67331 RepID=UPI003822C20F
MANNAPAIGADGAANGFSAVEAKLAALQKAAIGLQEETGVLVKQMRVNANAALKVAELSAAAEVDSRHVAAVVEIGAAFARVVGGCKVLIAAADTVHQATGHLRAEHKAEYGGIHAAVTASRARQAKPGFYRPL